MARYALCVTAAMSLTRSLQTRMSPSSLCIKVELVKVAYSSSFANDGGCIADGCVVIRDREHAILWVKLDLTSTSLFVHYGEAEDSQQEVLSNRPHQIETENVHKRDGAECALQHTRWTYRPYQSTCGLSAARRRSTEDSEVGGYDSASLVSAPPIGVGAKRKATLATRRLPILNC